MEEAKLEKVSFAYGRDDRGERDFTRYALELSFLTDSGEYKSLRVETDLDSMSTLCTVFGAWSRDTFLASLSMYRSSEGGYVARAITQSEL